MNSELNIKKVLCSAGWFEGRKIDTSAIEEKYKKFGYDIFPAALKFLEEFGNLEIVNYQLDEHCHTSPEKVLCEYFSNGSFTEEEKYAGERLLLVGEECNGELLLFVSESGKIYNSTGKLGNSSWEALDAIINKRGNNYKEWGIF